MQLSEVAASSPIEGTTGDHETTLTEDEESLENSKTCQKIGPIPTSSEDRREGKWEITKRDEAP